VFGEIAFAMTLERKRERSLGDTIEEGTSEISCRLPSGKESRKVAYALIKVAFTVTEGDIKRVFG
jgi:hypothetical protein